MQTRRRRCAGSPRECVEDLAADGVVYAEMPLRPRAAPRRRPDPRRGRRGRAGRLPRGRGGGRRGRHADPGRRAAHRDAARRPVARDRRAGRRATATRAWSASTSPAPRRASRPPGTSTRSSTCGARTPTSPSTPARRSGCRRSGRRIQWCGADRLGHGVRIVDDITVDDGRRQARPAGAVRPRQADPAGDVPVVQRADRRRRLDRRAPDRAAARSCGSGSRSTPTTG